MKTIDLHTHSTCSDGSMSPRELVRHASASGLSAFALSDHDSMAGVRDALDEGAKCGIEVIPALELSAISDTETHILGYFIDIDNKALNARLEDARVTRLKRQEETCKKLRALGFDVSMEEVWEYAESGVLCRAHFAKLMTKKGYVSSPKEAFDLYLSSGKPAYSNNQLLTDEECVSLIKNAGGIAICAHLHLTKKPEQELRSFIKRLKNAGLDGIEGFYTDYTPEMQAKYTSMAEEFGMVISGGTDFHGSFKPHITIGKGLGNMEIPYSVLENLKSYHNNIRKG